MKKSIICKFEFVFYNKFARNYQKYFEDNMRLPIWNIDEPSNTMTAEFVEYKEVDNKIIGLMNVLIDDNIDLMKLPSNKYLMNHPEDLVGHLFLIKLMS